MDGEPEREDVEVSVSFYELYKDRHRILRGSFQWRQCGKFGKGCMVWISIGELGNVSIDW